MASFLVIGVVLGLAAHGVLTLIIELNRSTEPESGEKWRRVGDIGMTLAAGYNLLVVVLLAWLVLSMLLQVG
ncbi:MAG: hypothetical protein IMX00_07265 [Limnochordales bacterium]|nr:hypothetical protein [Limnochordales bacterium]